MPEGPPEVPDYVQGPNGFKVQSAASGVIRVYKDTNAWFGENRDEATLLSMGRVLGSDYFVHPLEELKAGIPADTCVALMTSNGAGLQSSSQTQSHPDSQASLASFLAAGGVAVVHMGDNDGAGGYKAPGAIGTPTLLFPNPAADATFAADALGPDQVLGTADDHPIIKGPDGVAGTADDLDNAVIDACCSVAHGNLADGIMLPPNAKTLITARFGGVDKPIMAEYEHNGGRVILTTMTLEFGAHHPQGNGPAVTLRNLFAYALSFCNVNQPPIAKAKNVTVAAGDGCVATVTAAQVDDGSGDPDGESVTLTLSPAGPFGLGTTPVILTVSDAAGATSTAEASVTVEDQTPPTTNAASAPITIWPPNHKLHGFELSQFVTATDACSGPVTLKVLGIYSDEPEDAPGQGDGSTIGDIVMTGPTGFKLRAERQGGGNGRVYGVKYEARDQAGNVALGLLTVQVPHDQVGAPAVDDGPSAGYATP